MKRYIQNTGHTIYSTLKVIHFVVLQYWEKVDLMEFKKDNTFLMSTCKQISTKWSL